MDISTIIKKLDISSFKVFFLRIFGGKGAVYEYIAQKANTAVNALLEAKADQVKAIREKMAAISSMLRKFTFLLPDSWVPYAEHINNCFFEVYRASEDDILTTEEGKMIVNMFKIAFADYMAD